MTCGVNACTDSLTDSRVLKQTWLHLSGYWLKNLDQVWRRSWGPEVWIFVQLMLHPAKNRIHKEASVQLLGWIDIGSEKPTSSVTHYRPDKLSSLCVKSVWYQNEVQPRQTADLYNLSPVSSLSPLPVWVCCSKLFDRYKYQLYNYCEHFGRLLGKVWSEEEFSDIRWSGCTNRCVLGFIGEGGTKLHEEAFLCKIPLVQSACNVLQDNAASSAQKTWLDEVTGRKTHPTGSNKHIFVIKLKFNFFFNLIFFFFRAVAARLVVPILEIV